MARGGGKWTVLSIDPSINSCGFCGWDGGKPVQWGLIHPPRALKPWRLKAAHVRDQILALVRLRDPMFTVVESPETLYSRQDGDADGTIKLAYLVGAISALLTTVNPPSAPRFAVEVTPDGWKGRAPKKANLTYVNAEYGVALGESKGELDVADAIGVGAWFHVRATPADYGRYMHLPGQHAKEALFLQALQMRGWRQ